MSNTTSHIVPLMGSRTPVTVVCVSDTHNKTPAVPDGDLFLHAGDLTKSGTFEELQAQLSWINTLPHEHKIVIAGNHDFLLDPEFVERFPKHFPVNGYSRADLDWGTITYLENSSTTITIRGRQFNIFGCPLTPDSGKWAFQHPTTQDIWRDLLPVGTDILLSHGPPKGYLDFYEKSRGCKWLLSALWRAKPRLVVFGHIHAGHGLEQLNWGYMQRVHDNLATRDLGLPGVILMALAKLVGRFWHTLFGTANQKVSTLVNAAVVSGKGNIGDLPPRIVYL